MFQENIIDALGNSFHFFCSQDMNRLVTINPQKNPEILDGM